MNINKEIKEEAKELVISNIVIVFIITAGFIALLLGFDLFDQTTFNLESVLLSAIGVFFLVVARNELRVAWEHFDWIVDLGCEK